MDVMESLEIWWELNTPYMFDKSCAEDSIREVRLGGVQNQRAEGEEAAAQHGSRPNVTHPMHCIPSPGLVWMRARILALVNSANLTVNYGVK